MASAINAVVDDNPDPCSDRDVRKTAVIANGPPGTGTRFAAAVTGPIMPVTPT